MQINSYKTKTYLKQKRIKEDQGFNLSTSTLHALPPT